LQRRVEAGNKHLEETQKIAIVDDSEADSEINLNETQTFKLNIEE
jgi:cell division initiation protein